MFNDNETALSFLKKLSHIIMPTDFTYLNHCTFYIPERYRNNYHRKTWNEFPKDGFSVKGEMSFTERTERIRDALQRGGTSNAHTTYNLPSIPHLPFIIRVVIPKNKNNLNLSKEHQQEVQNIMTNFGHGHAKLHAGDKVIMFANSSKDEVSGKEIDILYGIREKDLIVYANTVFNEILKTQKLKEVNLPEVYEVKDDQTGQIRLKYNEDFEFEKQVYIIPKDKNAKKYENRQIVDKNHVPQATMLPQYESMAKPRKSR